MLPELNVIDLFAGCGGLSLGFQKAGYNIKAAFDNWDKAIETYSKNFNHPIFKADLLNVNNVDIDFMNKFNPLVIIGGPPCQDYSHAGKRDESLGRSDLTVSFAEIVVRILPDYFVMENVDQIKNSSKLIEAINLFKKAGYGITTTILDASRCNVPQKRKRFFMIGEMGGKDQQLLSYLESKLASKPMTIREYLGNTLGIEHYYRHPRNYNRRGIFSIDEPAPTIRGVNRPVPPGYKGHKNDSTPLTPEIRALTTIERSYLQTFPFDFIFEGTKSDLEQMIGNAVPVNLAQFVALCLKNYIDDKSKLIHESENHNL